MHKISEDLFQNALDLNETIVYEYHIKEDVISFSENVKNHIPLPLRVPSFVEKMNARGKIHQDDMPKAIAFFSAKDNSDKVYMDYIRFLNFGGEYRWYQVKGRLIANDKQEAELLYGTLTYVDEETKQQDELSKLSRDPLTHMLNVDAVVSSVQDYLKAIPQEVIPNLMVVDIDDFQSLIEIHGEVIADGVITEVSRILKRAFRAADIIGRLDSGRFVVCMKGVRAPHVLLERAAYICQTIKEVWSDFEESCALSVSVGIASMHIEEADFAKLYEKALLALVDAKESGKDTYILYASDMERMDHTINPVLSTKEMELVKNILNPMCAWAYAVDENYQLLYRNDLLQDRIGNEGCGICYVQNKGYDEPCPDCPLKKMRENESAMDCEVYSPSLRTVLPMRTTKITMRNGKNVYLLASVKEDIDTQIAALNESTERFQEAIYQVQNIIWDVNVSKNTCVRIKEQDVMSVVDTRIENYENLREFYKKHVVFREDLEEFNQATDPRYLKEAVKTGKSIVCKEVRLHTAEDTYAWYSIYTVLEQETNKDQDMRVFIISLNIDESKKRYLEMIETNIKYELMKSQSSIQKEMALNNERYENVNEMTGVLVFEYNKPENKYYLCSMFDEVFKVDKSMLVDEWSLLDSLRCHADDQDAFEAFKEKAKKEYQTQKITVRLYNRYDTAIWFTVVLQMLRGLNNEPIRFLGTLQNVNAEMEVKVEMEYRADYDSLTGLYNSEAFYRRVSEMIHLNAEDSFVMLSVDIDRFRIINDRFGIDVGNKSLQLLGRAIKETLPRMGLAKRYQGDTFSILLVYQSDQSILDYMTKLSDKAAEYFDKQWNVSLSFGIYKIVDNSLPIRLMCDRARIVKKQIKGNSLANYAVYDDKIRLQQREQAEIESEMNAALAKGEFLMYLQPKVDVNTGKISGAEALVRWKHPIRGLRVPATFLDLFESNGFITKLDLYMWEEACKYLVKLREQGIDLPISVNISRIHIHNTDLVPTLLGLVEKYQLEPRMLELEITENLFIDDVTELFKQMNRLKEAGFVIQMDDFGSGYSSLNMLRKAPVDVLKIDRFFLDEIMSTERGKIIVETSVRMAKQLGLIVVAEGVETKEQLEFLRGVNCDTAQGFYFSKPVPVDEFEALLQNGTAEGN
ncbi:MAG TPA: EAL domain-containing protein [Lachnospiraceae bacterium]|nr:EAL domain-containing protein [Lachnospiraceae bacterium]